MFKNPFSFEGRIRRTEYGVSFIIYIILAGIINIIIASNEDAGIFGLLYVPMLWFLWAQGAKRSHDVGNNGWWQLIPFYVLWLLFQDGETGSNQYGENPKGIQSINNVSSFSGFQQNSNGQEYQGGYNGGHNNPVSNYSSGQNQGNSKGYQSGDLYK